MTKLIGTEAQKPNPTLKPFEPRVGEWRTTGTHPLLPGKTLHGRASFSWIEGDAFLILRSEVDEPGVPSGTAIFGSDDAENVLDVVLRRARRLAEVRDHHQRRRDDLEPR